MATNHERSFNGKVAFVTGAGSGIGAPLPWHSPARAQRRRRRHRREGNHETARLIEEPAAGRSRSAAT